MCGIWGFLGNFNKKNLLYESFMNIKERGPDSSQFIEIQNNLKNFMMGFHRLSIINPSNNGNQPFYLEDEKKEIYFGCNGEIYNYKELIEKHNLKNANKSDCEVIIYLYQKYGIEKTLEEINAEFAFFIIEIMKDNSEINVYLARDQCGIRPMFWCFDEENLGFCSELKGLTLNMEKPDVKQLLGKVEQLPPRKYAKITIKKGEKLQIKLNDYISFDSVKAMITDENEAKKLIRKTLIESVKSRIISDREIGALLSGGLDSSLVCSILARELKKQGRILKTFSIGLPGGTDKEYAEMVAKHIGSNHTHIEFSNEEFLKEVGNIVKMTEVYDITTIRATTGNHLVAKWIKENTNIKVLLLGDGSDEITGGYLYFHKAPNEVEFHSECLRLVNEIHLYDVLRVDRSISSIGLEARVPFLEKNFIKSYFSIDPKLRLPRKNRYGNVMEKLLLRDSFYEEKNEDKFLPDVVLYRIKEAFSDGVSSKKNSWYKIIQDHCHEIYSDKEFNEFLNMNSHLLPPNKEAYHFRKLFINIFGKENQEIVSKFWLPKWNGNITDPSARVLDNYNN